MQDKQITAIYLRISDDREGRELGVDRQREHCIELAARHGLDVYDIYNDNDKGASRYSKKPRKNYQRMLADAKAGRFTNIVAYTTGRLTRRPREHENQIDLAQDHGIRFLYVRSPSFDLNTAAGRRVAGMLAYIDAGEADDISERVADAKRKQASKGLYLGGRKAYGYEGPQYNDRGELTNRGRINVALVDEEVAIFVSAVRRIIAGETPFSVMKDMNQRGIPAPTGGKWTVGNFKRLLIKKRYVIFDEDDSQRRGTLEHQGKEYPAVWPGIITRAEYELMLARFNATKQPWDHGPIHGRTYLLTGFTYCGACGGIVYGNARKKNGRYERRYRCKPDDNHGGRIACGKVFRLAEPFEAYVTEAVLTRFDTPEVIKALAPKEAKNEVGHLADKLNNLRQRRTELLEEYGRGEHTKEEHKVMLAANDRAIHACEDDMAAAQSAYIATTLPAISRLREMWEGAAIEWRRSVIQLLVERVEILPHGHTGSRTWNGWRFNPDSVRIVWRDVAIAEVAAQLSALATAAVR